MSFRGRLAGTQVAVETADADPDGADYDRLMKRGLL